MSPAPERVIAVDWSGRSGPDQAGHIWIAESVDGRIVRLERGRSRVEMVRHLVEIAGASSGLVVGLDFAFSLPSWYLEASRIASAPELWERVAGEALTSGMRRRGLGRWMRHPDWPFWRTGRPPDLTPELRFRRTELDLARAGTRPKSVFQLVGAGQVGPGSLYGMQALRELSRAGFHVWPLTGAAFPLAVEIFPRALTGPVVKSDSRARGDFLAPLALEPAIREAAAGSEDAFDALVSAVRMAESAQALATLPPAPAYALEGKIWFR